MTGPLHESRPHVQPDRVLALLDIGSARIVCMIAAVEHGTGRARVLGLAAQRSRGVKSGVVIDLGEAEQAIRAAVARAESAAGVLVEDAIVAVTGGRLRSHRFAATARLDDEVPDIDDHRRLVDAAQRYVMRDGRLPIHLAACEQPHVAGPDGVRLHAPALCARFHAVTADEQCVRNLLQSVERARLAVRGLVPAPLAALLAVTTPAERQSGVVVVDMGAGLTGLAAAVSGAPAAVASLAVGAAHLSYDLARLLGCELAEAERIKTLYGNMRRARSDEHEQVSYPSAVEEGRTLTVTRAQLHEAMAPRVAEILGRIKATIDSEPAFAAMPRVVLTGGGSQLAGVGEVAAGLLGKPVRIGRPAPVPGLAASACSPALSTPLGLLAALSLPQMVTETLTEHAGAQARPGYLGRLSEWISQSF